MNADQEAFTLHKSQPACKCNTAGVSTSKFPKAVLLLTLSQRHEQYGSSGTMLAGMVSIDSEC